MSRKNLNWNKKKQRKKQYLQRKKEREKRSLWQLYINREMLNLHHLKKRRKKIPKL